MSQASRLVEHTAASAPTACAAASSSAQGACTAVPSARSVSPASALSVRALYLHVPFCRARCRYCDFTTEACPHDGPRMAAYAASLARLVGQARGLGLLGGLETGYVGGGTPTMLGGEGLASLLAAVRGPAALAELTFEANPESLTDEVLASARGAGATRVSIGVQSLDDGELRALGRIHTASCARGRVRAAVAAGLATSVDLMCAIPRQTAVSWARTLDEALALGVGHVSCYPLMIEPGTPMARLVASGALPAPSDDEEADRMEQAERALTAAGLARYEVASYARPGQRCRHNLAYWTGVPYLGLGTSAASMLGRAAYMRLRAAAPGLPVPASATGRIRLTCASAADEVAAARGLSDLRFDVEQLTTREAAAEDLMLASRLSDGLSADLLARARDVLGRARVDRCVDGLVTRGLLVPTSGAAFAPTHAGWLLGNEVAGPLWDLATVE